MSLQCLQGLLHSGKRRRTNNITQAVNDNSASAKWRDNVRELFRQEICRTDVPVNHARRFLLLHPKTVDEPHLLRIKISVKTPTIQTHLRHNILPGATSREVDSWPTVKQSSVHDLLSTSSHPSIGFTKE